MLGDKMVFRFGHSPTRRGWTSARRAAGDKAEEPQEKLMQARETAARRNLIFMIAPGERTLTSKTQRAFNVGAEPRLGQLDHQRDADIGDLLRGHLYT